MKVNKIFTEYSVFQDYYLESSEKIEEAETSDIKLKKRLSKILRKLLNRDFKYMNAGKGKFRKKSKYERKAERLERKKKGKIPSKVKELFIKIGTALSRVCKKKFVNPVQSEQNVKD